MPYRSTNIRVAGAVVLWLLASAATGQEAVVPRAVKVLPVFFVPRGERAPNADQTKRLLRHLNWSRTRFREMLHEKDTFAIADAKPRIHKSARPLAFFRAAPESGAPEVVGELLTDLKVTRYSCPYVLLVTIMNPQDDFPTGGGRPLNGGFNTGGGIVVLSSHALDNSPNFQSTLQHELGHSFGLPHVDVFGYDMKTNESIMSYNPGHHTKAFEPSSKPGTLIPEDLRGLALNQRVFSKLRFDRARDVPAGYALAERVLTLGPMQIPGQPDLVKVATESGEDFGSKVGNIVQHVILPGKSAGKVTYDAGNMWQSAKSTTGWVAVEVTFPFAVELTRVGVHSQHSGQYHPARSVRIAVQKSDRQFSQLVEADLKTVDEAVTFPTTKGQHWRFEFQAGESGCVVLRGLQFFSGNDELFPPLVPWEP